MNNLLQDRIVKMEKIADDLGLDYYPINYEIVSQETMLEVMSIKSIIHSKFDHNKVVILYVVLYI